MHVTVSTDAAAELERAAIWYESEARGLGARLIDEFASAIQLLREPNPPLTPALNMAAARGAKKLLLYRFPYSLIIIQRDDGFIVIALAHHSKKPGYWLTR
jgi:hypothetical protein